MIDNETLSAYLDKELSRDEAQEVDAALQRDPEAAAALERLRCARDAVAGGQARALSAGEVRRLDAAIAESLDAALGPEADAEVVALRSGRGRKPSPRKRGRPAAPYFAAAAVIALLLIVMVGILASSVFGPRSSDVTKEAPAPRETAEGRAGDASEETAVPPAAQGELEASQDGMAYDSDALADTEGLPRLFVSDVAPTNEDALREILASARPVTVSRDQAIRELASLAAGVGIPDLGSCLATIPSPFTPALVQTGTWQGIPVYFVAGSSSPGGAADTLYVKAQHDCASVLSVAA